ncbi:hypothetical protein NQ318_011696 [Aromia moschata]|uniref:Uncharacterized protein n=1 Tax=Aromia moschata TaxID=1265417 RepID=A0AAV8XHA0_9CUCU|nr:hypothetical protein NQ318_011696 [Aromia moschata]
MEFLLQSPMAAGMRGRLDSPVCFPISTGTGSCQFMPQMSAGYSKLEAPLPPPPPPPAVPVHSDYMQVRHLLLAIDSAIIPDVPEVFPNPLAQLQQQTDMWHSFHDDIRPRSSGNPYMMQQEMPPAFQHQPSPPLSIPSPMMMDKQHRQTPHALHQANGAPPLPITPPLSNVSVDKGSEEPFDAKHAIDPAAQPLVESNGGAQQADGFASTVYAGQAGQRQFEKAEDAKMKKPAVPPQVRTSSKKPMPKPLPDFNEAFGTTERGRFQSPPDPRLAPNKGYLDFFYEDNSQIKFDDFQIALYGERAVYMIQIETGDPWPSPRLFIRSERSSRSDPLERWRLHQRDPEPACSIVLEYHRGLRIAVPCR